MAGLLASSLPTRAPPALGRAGRPSCRPLAARRLAQPPRGLFGGNKEARGVSGAVRSGPGPNGAGRALVPAAPPNRQPTAASEAPTPPPMPATPPPQGGGGGNPFANMGGLMENMRKAQEEAARVQKELSE